MGRIKHEIEVVVDRLVLRPGLDTRVADSIETALSLADGLALAEDADTGERIMAEVRRHQIDLPVAV